MEHKYMTSNRCEYPVLKEHAQHMRKEPTEAESILWQYLNSKHLGIKFRRQHIIDSYIVDFVCLSKKLVIEVDGKYHDKTEQKALDEQRHHRLRELGFTIIRFTNEQVMCDIENTILSIKNHLQNAN
ncbi:MAG: endonuclease domain-containing protein [Paludibacteraceae bacterium]|nr:endonuclease domain-containing protein [Paludibacteraceae bacterium]